jgi:hypothetical protein
VISWFQTLLANSPLVPLQDGVQLQGEFGSREKAGVIREFIAGSLREPFRPFSLTFLNAPLNEGGDAAVGLCRLNQVDP